MPFNISEITSEISRLGIMKNNKFLVQFPMPLSLQNTTNFQDLTNTNNVMSLYCEASGLPGIAHLLEEIRRYGYGANEKKPYAPIFTDTNMVFRGDAQGRIWTFLNSWMRCAVNFESRGDFNTVSGPIKNQYPYEVGYKYDPQNGEGYATDTTVSVFDDTGNEQMRVVLREAYPVFVGDIPLNWSSRSDYMRIPVTMTFFDWYNDLTFVNNTSNIAQAET